MCSLDYENIINIKEAAENKRKSEAEDDEQEYDKTIEGSGGYFKEPGGYIVDVRNRR